MFACIFVPNFSMATILRAEPDLRTQAVAIFEGKPPLEKIVAVNEDASRMGIAIAMTKGQAEFCSEVVLRARSLLQESGAHAALLDCAESFSPCVEDTACDTAVLDLAGMESLFGASQEIAEAISRRAADLGLKANVAVASNPDTAMLAARGFSGVRVIPCGKETDQLGSLPIAVLFANGRAEETDANQRTGEILDTLERWGVHNLRALASLPSVALSERLGQEGLRLQQLARGAASRTLVPVEEPAQFEEAIQLEFPVVLLEPLAFLLNRLLEQICARLNSRALRTQQLRLTLELETFHSCGLEPDFENHQSTIHNQQFKPEIENCQSQIGLAHFQRTLNFPLPMLDPKLFLKLLQLDLNAHPPGAPIKTIHLAAEPAQPRFAQGGLFLPPSPEPEKLELTLARIANIVGKSRAGSVELLDTHRTEGFRMCRFTPETRLRTSNKTSSRETSAVAALRMFRPPLRAKVVLENDGPAHVACAKKKEVRGIVLWKAGPWRSSGDWWEREAWSRDEWDIALQNETDVALYRLVHDLLNGGWFVEGMYD